MKGKSNGFIGGIVVAHVDYVRMETDVAGETVENGWRKKSRGSDRERAKAVDEEKERGKCIRTTGR